MEASLKKPWLIQEWAGFVAMIQSPAWIRTYLWTEGALAIPTLLMFLFVIVERLGPSHGFSMGELMVPVPVFAVASVAPLFVGWRAFRRAT